MPAVNTGTSIRPAKSLELLARPGIVHAAARDHAGPLGPAQQLDRCLDPLPGAARSVAGPVALRPHHVALFDLPIHHVHRDLEKHRTGSPRHAVAEGHGRELVDPTGLVDDPSPLDQGPDDVDLLELLKGERLGLVDSASARDDQQGRVRLAGVGHARHGVREARPRRHHAHAGLSRQTTPRLGHVGRGLLVARIDHADAAVQAGLVDGVDVPSTQTEDVLHTLALEGIHDQAAAVHCRHRSTPHVFDLGHAGPLFACALAEVTVTMIVAADALLSQIPQELDAPLGENGSRRHEQARLPRGLEDRRGDAPGRSVADPFGSALEHHPSQLGVGLLDELDGAGPGLGQLFEQREARRARPGRGAHGDTRQPTERAAQTRAKSSKKPSAGCRRTRSSATGR